MFALLMVLVVSSIAIRSKYDIIKPIWDHQLEHYHTGDVEMTSLAEFMTTDAEATFLTTQIWFEFLHTVEVIYCIVVINNMWSLHVDFFNSIIFVNQGDWITCTNAYLNI